MMYHKTRRFLRWLCNKLDQQCSGRYEYGYALIGCMHNAFHDGPCVDVDGQAFSRPYFLRGELVGTLRTNGYSWTDLEQQSKEIEERGA